MVAKAPSSHDLGSTLARDWAFQVDTTDGSETPNWVFVRGLSQFAPVTNLVMQDDSDIDNGGHKSQVPTAKDLTITAQGKRKGKVASGVFTEDPGQAYLRKKGDNMGFGNFAHIRYWRTDGVQEGKETDVSVQFEQAAGGNEDLDNFTITMMSRGTPLDIKPVTNATGPSVPADESTEGGE